jgi:hypothetical protein
MVMSRFANNVFGLAALGWVAISYPADGQAWTPAVPANQGPPPDIKLNGLTTILGDKRALFKVRPDSGPVESYFLAEGQSAGTIKLLSVDIRAGRIKINNHGVIQTVALCDAPDLSILMATEAGGSQNGNGFSSGQNPGDFSANSGPAGSPAPGGAAARQNSGAGFSAGNSTGGVANGSPGAAAGNNFDKSANPGTSNASSNNSDNSGSNSDNTSQHPEPYSLTAAREFERLRIETASGVYNGTDEPLPLTPLTPPGTPKALIGPDRAWFPD